MNCLVKPYNIAIDLWEAILTTFLTNMNQILKLLSSNLKADTGTELMEAFHLSVIQILIYTAAATMTGYS